MLAIYSFLPFASPFHPFNQDRFTFPVKNYFINYFYVGTLIVVGTKVSSQLLCTAADTKVAVFALRSLLFIHLLLLRTVSFILSSMFCSLFGLSFVEFNGINKNIRFIDVINISHINVSLRQAKQLRINKKTKNIFNNVLK